LVSQRLAAASQQRGRANTVEAAIPKPPSAKALSFAFLRRAEDREREAQARLEALQLTVQRGFR
jgi:hypothetical protein